MTDDIREIPAAIDVSLEAEIRALLTAGVLNHTYSAAACAVALGGRTVVELYLGTLASFGPNGAPVPVNQRAPVTPSSLFDLASLTKVFSAHTALTLVEAGRAELDAPIGSVLPSYRDGDRGRVTLRHLLSQTSGLPATWAGWRAPLEAWLGQHLTPDRITVTPLTDRDALIADLLREPLTAPPGTRFEYACTGYNTAMAYLEELTGESWRTLVSRYTLAPLGLTDVTADPAITRTAATEFQPQYRRGVVHGVVHDETSWSLGGGTGNAGLFGSARDVLAFGEAIRRGDDRVCGTWMWDDALTATLGRATASLGGGFGSALGLRIGDAAFLGRSATARGHTGFTGTSLLIDREGEATVVLLTNRVHPTRSGQSLQPLRARVADLVADASGAAR